MLNLVQARKQNISKFGLIRESEFIIRPVKLMITVKKTLNKSIYLCNTSTIFNLNVTQMKKNKVLTSLAQNEKCLILFKSRK